MATSLKKGSALWVVRQCVRLLDSKLRKRWFLLIPLALTAAALEAAGAGLIFVLLKMVSGNADLSALPLIGDRIDPTPFGEHTVLVFGGLVAGFYALKNLFLLAQNYVAFRSASTTVITLASRFLRGYLGAPYTLHLRRSSSELIRNVQQAVDGALRIVLVSAVQLASEAVVAVSLVAVLLYAAPLITLVIALTSGIVIAILLRLTQRRLGSLGKRAHDAYAGIFATLQQSLAGVKELKVLGREQSFVEAHDAQRRVLATVQWRRGTLEAGPRLFIETLFVFAVVGVMILARASGQDDEVVPVLGLFGYAGLRILPSVNRSIWNINQMHFAAPQIEALVKDWEEIIRPVLLAPKAPPAESVELKRSIALEDVSFTYPGAERASLDHISLAIERGQTVGIVGPTGAGKSTLLDVLLGLLEPTSGRITVDGADLRGRMASFQRKIGYVPQTILLFDDTLRRNIALGIPDREIDPDRVQRAVQMAQLEKLIATLPEGLDTKVGERGVRLSGGERQRVAVARALYHQPEILVFDEATSALDNETEAALQQAIESLGGDRTLIIVAHRLATVQRADLLVFLDGGKLADTGTYDQLLVRNEHFRRMAEARPPGA